MLPIFGFLVAAVSCNTENIFNSNSSKPNPSISSKTEEGKEAKKIKFDHKIFDETPEIRVTNGINGQRKSVPD